MTTVLPNGELQSNPRIAYNKGYEQGKADQKKKDNEFFNFESAWELEKQKIKAEAIEEVIKTLAEHDKQVRADTLDDFANWLKEKGIHGSKEYTRILRMYEEELKGAEQ